jgi:AcrR family transcriptional regulator
MALRQRARNDEDKQVRRAEILTQAAALLGKHPYARITMSQVAAGSGLAKGTLYLYFRSKEELFLALLQRELVACSRRCADGSACLPRWTRRSSATSSRAALKSAVR